MAADLHIHVFKEGELTDEDFECFFGNALGSKWSSYNRAMKNHPEIEAKIEADEKLTEAESTILADAFRDGLCESCDCTHWKRVSETENFWVGEVSWLKAGLLDDSDSFIPSLVEQVVEVFADDPVLITDEVVQKVRDIGDPPNNTAKEGGVWSGKGYSLAKSAKIVEFLEKHKGEYAYTVSW